MGETVVKNKIYNEIKKLCLILSLLKYIGTLQKDLMSK